MPKSKSKSVERSPKMQIVTANDFITAVGLESMTLKAKKLLYVAISQVKLTDKEFYEFKLTPLEFSDMMRIDVSHVYGEAEKICDELSALFLKVRYGEKSAKNYSVFSTIEYSDSSDIIFELDKNMSDFLLELKGHFSKPLLEDFMMMRSTYSMSIWHLMQEYMHSKKPMMTQPIEFDITLKELREVTGTDTVETYNKISNFKNKILDKSLREIKDTAGVKVTYTDIKRGRTVKGFHFKAESLYEPAEPFDVLWVEQVKERAKHARKKGQEAQ